MKVRLTRADLLGATACPTEDVPVPELGGVITVRGMTGQERDKYEAGLFAGKGKNREINLANARAKMVAFCCVDEQGHRVFTDEDAATLGAVRADVLTRIFGVAQRLSGLSEEDLDELGKSIKGAETLPTDPAGGSSSSALPANWG